MLAHLLFICILQNFIVCTQSFDSHTRGPSFVMEPPTKLEFSNSSGGWLDCSASGNPPPTIEWITVDGANLGNIDGVRQVLSNGTLILLPFPAAAYRQDIHNTIYKCVASNTVGRIISHDIQIKAVVTQIYRVEVEVIGAPRGCSAILRCRIPSFVRDFVRVLSWIQEPSFYIYPSLQGDGKYHQLPSGELLIHNLEFTDQSLTYRCRTIHRLSQQIVVSSPANIAIRDVSHNRGIAAPIILESNRNVIVGQDEGAALICIAQGCPSPTYRWYSVFGTEILLKSGSRIKPLPSVLAIEAVTPDDDGTYKCSVSNTGGEESAEFRLIVSSNLRVEILPPSSNIHIGGAVEFKCKISSTAKVHLLTWYKDGRQLSNPAGSFSETLVISKINREDRGMYQCIVKTTAGETAQASAELQLGDELPTLLYSFIEQTLQPGPAVSLKCTASGNPTPQISWTLDGFPLPSHGRFVIGQYYTTQGDVISHVNISHVMVEDGGEYSCIAENRAGKSSHSARLNVYGMPYIRLIPKVTAVAGENLQLKCPVAGYPIEEIHWEKNGRELPDDLRQKVLSDGTLIINFVEKKSDSGVYTCWARNKHGQTARRSGEVTVIVPPKISPFYIEDNLHIGDRASLTCSVTKGDLPLMISWRKDGHDVESSNPTITVSSVDQFTSILVIERLSPAHNGNYTCIVSNVAAVVSHSHQLVVNVPPIIEPFSFQDGLSEGMRTRTVCGVSSGDPPLAVSWLKDGQPLTPALGVNVSALDTYSSLLSVSSLNYQHSGNFTCVARNQAAEVRYTATLQVKVPPRWEIEPKDESVERNHQISIHCYAKGIPTPTITWKKALDKSGDYEPLKNQTYTKLLPNGTLVLQHVEESSEGYYMCQAGNGIGSVIGKVIQLKVHSPPYFTAPSRLVVVRQGSTAVLKCDVNGDKPLNVIWLRKRESDLNVLSNFRSNVKQYVTEDGVTAELQIVNTEAEDSGTYFCQANNLYGKDQQLIQLVVQEPPASPQNLEAGQIKSTSIQLKWTLKNQDKDKIFKFIVEYCEEHGAWKALDIVKSPLSYTAIIEDLKPATTYIFRVTAVGSAGNSLPSSELVVQTEMQRPSGPPINVSIQPLSSTQLIVTWNPPLANFRHGRLQGYYVGYKAANAGSFNFTNVLNDAENGGEILLQNLKKFTKYNIVVQAFNKMGAGPLSEPITAYTLEDVPSKPPEDFRCTPLTSQSLQVSWQPPPLEHCNGVLEGFKLIYEHVLQKSDVFYENENVETRKTTALTTVVTGLRKYANYSLQVLAFTKVGDGAISRPIYCHTEEDVPGNPEDIKVAASSSQSLILSWLPPLEPNGIIIKYNIYKRSIDKAQEIKNTKKTISSQHTSYELKGIQPQFEYQLWVTASTRVGEGQSSKVVMKKFDSLIPARIISFGTTIVRPWKTSVVLSCEAVGSPRRQWLRGDILLLSGTRSSEQFLDTGELILSNLQVSDSHNYTCLVENDQGSDKITYRLLVQVPPPPPLLHIQSATSNSILLSWKIAKSESTPITGFTLNFRKEHGNLEEIALSRHSTNFELKDLLCGTNYQLYMIAHNVIGSSFTSQPLEARTQGNVPGKPADPGFIQPNKTSVLLRLHLWPDNGCPISYFLIQYRKEAAPQWILVSNHLKPQKHIIITDLNPETRYVLKIEAHSSAGFSTFQFRFTTLTLEGTPALDTVRSDDGHFISIDVKILILGLTVLLLLVVGGIVGAFCFKRRQSGISIENMNNEIDTLKKERYSTFKKTIMQEAEKVPEYSEDISPYATFQLAEPPTLPLPQSALLDNMMYRGHPLRQECMREGISTSTMKQTVSYYNNEKLPRTFEMEPIRGYFNN